MKILNDISQCNGCGACEQSCPVKCISMQQDNEGFWRPIIDEWHCVKCRKCERICPVANPHFDDGQKPIAIAAKNKDDKVRRTSSSGGVFSAFAEKIIDMGGVVFGAGFDDKFNVVHQYTETKEGILYLRGSKYVQSTIGHTYIDCRNFLEAGRTVLFTGTPCQIGGLYSFLGKSYDNLYTQEFVCHGVPSPLVWSKYVQHREKSAKAKTQKVCFRSKNISWSKYSMRFEFVDGTEYSSVVQNDVYLRGFISDIYLRPSCYNCAFKTTHRMADMTLADFWGIDSINSEFNDDKGTSLLLIHSPAGIKLWNSVSQDFESLEVAFDEAIKSNPAYFKSVNKTELRNKFFKDLQNHKNKPIDKLILKYCGIGLIAKIRRFLIRLS